jgi:predicted peptidase
MHLIKIWRISALLCLAIHAFSQNEPPPFKKFTYIEKNDTLPYGLLKPLKPVPDEKYPLVIFLHGAGERGNDNEKHLKHIQILFTTNIFNKFPCYVIAPQCPKKQMWSEFMAGKPFNATPTRPMQLFLQVLDKVIKENAIDPSRIYVTGVSMGGFGTWDLLYRFPGRFAAAVPICGGADEKIAPQIKHIPVWVFHGASDNTVPPARSRTMVEALRRAGGNPGYTEYPDVEHNCWVHVYKEPYLLPWLWKHSLNPPVNDN